MPVFSALLPQDVVSEILLHYHKIRTHEVLQKRNIGLCRQFTYTLCDTAHPFELECFIDAVKPILNRFKINFAMGFILRSESGVRYYHPSEHNGCVWKNAFDISGGNDLMRFKAEFEKGNWLALTSHTLLRSNTKSVVACLANVCFYVSIVEDNFQYVGRPPQNMPSYFTRTTSVFMLAKNHKGRLYTDNLCFFVVLFARAIS